MKQYLDLVRDILENGAPTNGLARADRTGVGTYSVFGRQLRFNLELGFPLVTTKKCHVRSIIHELLWFLKGETNVHYLNANKVTIWDEWANDQGELGPVYGRQWRSWPTPDGEEMDQITRVIDEIKNNPTSRRHIVSAWNVGEIDKMALPPCHALFQFYVSGDRLSLQLYQRSADVMLGVPFNIASYALLLMMVAQVTHLKAHEFVHTFGDAHIYSNHVAGAREQIMREPQALPKMHLNPKIDNIFDFKFDDFQLEGYHPLERINFDIAV